MYSSSSLLALRAKGSLYHHHPRHHHHHHYHCFSGDRAAERCGCCCSLGRVHPPCATAAGFSGRDGIFASPRFLYGYWLRQSALICWSPSRIIVSSGGESAAAARYSRLTAAWDGDPCPVGEWKRWRTCGNRRVSRRVGVSHEGFQDMLDLLAEVEECLGEDDGAAADGAAEEAYVKEKVGFKLHGDSRRSEDFTSRGRDESSSSYYRNDETAEEEVREVKKHEMDSRLRRRYAASGGTVGLDSDTRRKEERTGGRGGNTVSLTGCVGQSRERYAQKDQCFSGQKESTEELQKVSKTSQVRQSTATERSVADKNMVNVIKEETSAAALLEVVRKQQDEMVQLRKDYQDLYRTTQLDNVSAAKTSASCSIFDTRVQNSGGKSTLPMGLLEEVRRQRSEIEELNENYKKLMRAYKMQESNMIRESNSTKSFGTVLEESSTSAVNLVEEGTVQHYNTDKQIVDDSRTSSSILTGTNELKKYHQQLKTSNIHEGDIRANTNYRKGQNIISENREKKAFSALNLVEEVQERHINITQDQQNIRYTDLEINTHQLTERTHIHNSSTETASRSWRHHATTIDDQRESTSSAVKWTGEREEQVSNINEKLSGHIDSRRNSQKLTDIVETHKNGVTKASTTQDHVKTTVKVPVESSTSVQHLVKLAKDERVQIDQHVIDKINVSKDTRSRINISEAFTCAGSATFTDHLTNEDVEQVTQQIRLRNDSQQRVPEFLEGGPVNVYDSQVAPTKKTKNTDDYSSLVFIQEPKEKHKNNLVEETLGLGSSSGTSESWYTSGLMQTHELDYHTESDGFDLVKDDVLESARCLAESSSHYIGEFVDQLNQKVSASEEINTTSYNSPETQMEAGQPSSSQRPKATTEYEDEVGKQEEPRQYLSRTEVAGPSDEIWNVRDASSQDPFPTEGPEKDSSSVRILGTANTPASTSGAIIKRSSKSLWSYIADIVRMGWRPHSSSQRSMPKSGTRSSSNESVNSDAWYSGHEPEDDQEENVKNGCAVTKESELNKATVSKPHSGTSSVLGPVASEVRRRRQGKKRMQEETDVSIPTEIIEGSYGSDGSPPAASLESLVPVDAGKGIEGIPAAVATTSVPSAVATASQSALLGSTSVDTSEEEAEIDRVHAAEVGSIKPEEGQKTEGISEVVGVEGKDVELKRRKLQRKKQVLREEFEEWEEAYKLEIEQRKIDEFFMREALLEAKKAADMWEVPVGAVLVQDGKIIARGCNLVEDLRDSTAHAEMICIREASSLLRTWRLVGTTLYVTLEPCPMCAGAILQARIDAVVWGAPNKLLGADGSWVRLFPGGDEGKQRLDQSDQAVGPVHPFHPKITIRRGVLAMECADTMQQFFQLRRKKKKPEPPPPSCLPINYPAKILTKMHNIFAMMACM